MQGQMKTPNTTSGQQGGGPSWLHGLGSVERYMIFVLHTLFFLVLWCWE
jgi:hypothetical protein